MNEMKELYERNLARFTRIRELFPEDEFDIPGPFLMNPSDIYFKQRNRLMIIGQQTNGWSYKADDIEYQMNHYKEFNVGEKYYSSPFWNITRKVEQAIGNSEYSCCWTNLNKYDLAEGKPFGEFETAISELDNILLEEIALLKPDICIFFTGPSLDSRIKKIFKDVEFKETEGWPIRQLSQLLHPVLPIKSYRTYHPRYLRMKYIEEDFIEFMESKG